MLEWDECVCGWAAVSELVWTLIAERHGHGGVLAVWQGLIELEGTARSLVGNGFEAQAVASWPSL